MERGLRYILTLFVFCFCLHSVSALDILYTNNVAADSWQDGNGEIAFNSQDNDYLMLYLSTGDFWSTSQVRVQKLDLTGAASGTYVNLTGNALFSVPEAIAYNNNSNEYLALFRVDPTGSDENYILKGQILDSDGALIGNNFTITGVSGGDERGVDMKYIPGKDEYIVVWGNVTGTAMIYAVRLYGNGTRKSDNVLVSDSSEDGYLANVAYNSQDDEYFVLWNYNYSLTEFENMICQGRILDSNLGYVGSILNFTGKGAFFCGDIAYNSKDNEYLLAFDNDTTVNHMRLDSSGTALSSIITVWDNGNPGDMIYNPDDREYLYIFRNGTGTDSVACARVVENGSIYETFSILTPTTGNQIEVSVAYNDINRTYIVGFHELNGFESTQKSGVIKGRRLPAYLGFTGSGTTDFRFASDLSAVPTMKLATSSGSINWSGNINVVMQDYDSYLRIGSGYVSMNVTELDSSINSSATVTLNADCSRSQTLYYAEGFYDDAADIVAENNVCNETTTPACSAIVCTGGASGTLTFNVEHFDSYGLDEGENVPEFSDLTYLLALVIVAGSFLIIRKKNGCE